MFITGGRMERERKGGGKKEGSERERERGFVTLPHPHWLTNWDLFLDRYDTLSALGPCLHSTSVSASLSLSEDTGGCLEQSGPQGNSINSEPCAINMLKCLRLSEKVVFFPLWDSFSSASHWVGGSVKRNSFIFETALTSRAQCSGTFLLLLFCCRLNQTNATL